MDLETLLLSETEHETLQKRRGFVSDLSDLNTLYSDGLPHLSSSFFFQNKDIYISKHNRYGDYPEHSHQFFELNYVYRGSCTQVINGESLQLQQGDILLMDTNSRHAIKALGSGDILINILFQNHEISIDWLKELQSKKSLLYRMLLKSSDSGQANHYLYMPAETTQASQATLERMMTEYFFPQAFSENIISQSLPILFYELARALPEASTDELLTDNTPYLQALDIIDREFSDLTLQGLADKLNFNKNYLSNLIKSKSGHTFTELVTQRKLMKAQLLLQSTRMPIHEIATTVGFSNKTYFYDKYKILFGHGPREERE
ncbi:AraC family transcriptional regulator [Streptococcus caprae]|uniref:Helix-turn-helix domain-containing protein n=1 Tax=Streptococcus caprae TaxID=1640501 RepID=A0ABV8CWX0_9STRE